MFFLSSRQCGIPLAFCINPGNENEQQSLISLEKKLMDKFYMSQFIVCTDAGLSSNTNRYFNNHDKEDGTRDFITTQSVKKFKEYLKKWALAPEGWRLSGSDGRTTYKIDELDEEKCLDKIYYKSRWIKEKVNVTIDGETKKVELKQQLIVTYSIKYRNYLRSIRNRQVERAKKALEAGAKAVEQKGQNDPKRFIKANYATEDGETAKHTAYYIDKDAITQEEKYDVFMLYAPVWKTKQNLSQG